MSDEEVAINFADAWIAIRASRSTIAAISFIFRHHPQRRETEALPRIELCPLLPPGVKAPLLVDERQSPTFVWTWHVAEDAETWLPERLFYRVLHPALFRALPSCGIARLQGALLCEGQDTILLLGDRGHGKTTTAAGWLNSGGVLTTDKTVLWNVDTLLVSGIFREMHITPNLIPYLPNMPSLKVASEYLPGRERLNYDWISLHPDRFAPTCASPSLVIDSDISNDDRTHASLMTCAEQETCLEGHWSAAAENQKLVPGPERLLVRLREASWLKVRWGRDVLRSEGQHLHYLQELMDRH